MKRCTNNTNLEEIDKCCKMNGEALVFVPPGDNDKNMDSACTDGLKALSKQFSAVKDTIIENEKQNIFDQNGYVQKLEKENDHIAKVKEFRAKVEEKIRDLIVRNLKLKKKNIQVVLRIRIAFCPAH